MTFTAALQRDLRDPAGTVVVSLLGAIVPAWLSARGDVVESLRSSD